MALSTIKEAIDDMEQGKMIILVDDEDRENEGDLVIAAEKVTPEAINIMAKHGRGLICLTITEERAKKLRLTPMVRDNTASFHTAFTISIDARTATSLVDVISDSEAEDKARKGGKPQEDDFYLAPEVVALKYQLQSNLRQIAAAAEEHQRRREYQHRYAT